MSAGKVSSLRKGERVAGRSVLAAIFLAVLKGLVGVLSGSIALLADAVHSLSDVFGSVTVWIGLRLSQRKPTQEFPYGYYRAETLASLAVSVVIFISGVQILVESGKRLAEPSSISFSLLALSTAVLSATCSYVIAQYKKKTGQEINSQALIGEGKHSMIDVYVSLTVFAGLLFSQSKILWVEPLAGLLIGAVVAKTSITLVKDATMTLMDACMKPEYLAQVKAMAETVHGVIGVHEIKMRRSGPYVFGEMHIEVDEEMPVDKSHAISEEIGRKVKEKIREIDSLTIHAEPARAEAYRIVIPVGEDRGIESSLNLHLGRAPYLLFIDVKRGQIEKWFVRANPGAELEKGKGIAAAKFLIENDADVLLTKEVGEGPFHVLRDNFVKIYKIPETLDIRQVLAAHEKEELEPITF
jgi:cation diffusion facilitator family transporter